MFEGIRNVPNSKLELLSESLHFERMIFVFLGISDEKQINYFEY